MSAAMKAWVISARRSVGRVTAPGRWPPAADGGIAHVDHHMMLVEIAGKPLAVGMNRQLGLLPAGNARLEALDLGVASSLAQLHGLGGEGTGGPTAVEDQQLVLGLGQQRLEGLFVVHRRGDG